MTKVLLTGGSGFIAAHILEQLLAKNHSVVTTVRTEEKAAKIREAYPSQAASGALTVAIVPDIAQPDAFDEGVTPPGLEVVLHTASPFHFRFSPRPQKELIDPAVIGTTAILRAIALGALGPSRRRDLVLRGHRRRGAPDRPGHDLHRGVVEPRHARRHPQEPATAYARARRSPSAPRGTLCATPASGAKFDLVTVNPPMVFGPVVHYLESLEGVNTSNERVVDCLRGKWREAVPPAGPVGIWVDVRDVATAHVKAGLEVPEAGGKRLFATAGLFSNAELGQIVRRNFPEDADKLPTEETKGGELPDESKRFRFDNSATNKLLGIDWISFEKSIVDTVRSLKKVGA
ncbi:hypothetical protein NEMBOFW57_010034 [Staphylotrichum longicolle]|uniref:NAD-dependent epimerase/dehydratase domain-containing protein n=1 Tax=Staphylotrichum longicolle TaxID=669026 RepID=A0AAD4HV79_9PEZI|nr:hypothetical protein NEMBOFW57_010034 [Staphylotrichum longicolle]